MVSDHLNISTAAGGPAGPQHTGPLSCGGQNPESLLGVWPAAAAVMKTFELFIRTFCLVNKKLQQPRSTYRRLDSGGERDQTTRAGWWVVGRLICSVGSLIGLLMVD